MSESAKNEIRKENIHIPTDIETVNREICILFASFDLSNSTLFKSKYDIWPIIVNQFYDLSVRELNKSNEFKVWKYVGDEVLFYKKIYDIESLGWDVDYIYESSKNVTENIYEAFEDTKNFLPVKSTAWIAVVEDQPPQDIDNLLNNNHKKHASNYIVKLPDNSGNTTTDFIGPDIDIGFRIGKYSHNGKLTISANLALTLLRSKPKGIKTKNFKIITYDKLRGVWNDRPYPIIWYHKDWENLKDSFLYDEIIENKLFNDASLNKNQIDISELENIFSDLNKSNEIDHLINTINSDDFSEIDDESHHVPANRQCELHCVGICFSSDGKVLIAKRSKDKKIAPDTWEFGCGQLRIDQTFYECLFSTYKNDFNVNINKLSDVPVNTFVIEKSRKIPGLIFYCEIDEDSNSALNKKNKYQEVIFIDPNDISNIRYDNLVNDFENSLNLALEYREKSEL